MAAAGKQAEEILDKSKKDGGYILIVEGGVPTKKGARHDSRQRDA